MKLGYVKSVNQKFQSLKRLWQRMRGIMMGNKKLLEVEIRALEMYKKDLIKIRA